MGKTSTLRNAILLLLVALICIGIGYKFLEWKTIKSLSDIETKVDREEIVLIEQQSKLGNKLYESLGKLLTGKEASAEAQLKQYDGVIGLGNQYINNQENYLKTIETNVNQYKKIEFQSKLLLGKRGNFAKQLLSKQNIYYSNEIDTAKEDLISNSSFIHLFTALKDRQIADDFDKKGQKNPKTYYYQHFGDISSLEKYTRSDFKFKDAEQIKNLFPYGWDSLNKYKDYLAAYYAVMKDYISGDLESASYKYSRLQETAINLSIDFDKLTTEGRDRKKERAKNVITSVTDKTLLIKDFKEENLGKYPLLPEVKKWQEDLVMCQTYNYKTSFYNLITDKYPDASNFDNLLTQLSEVAPKTDSVDSKFDKSTINYTTTDKILKFECKDKEDGKTFVFQIDK